MNLENFINNLSLGWDVPLNDSERKQLEKQVKKNAQPVERITKLAGVYFLLFDNEIVYIGQSTWVYHRIDTHIAESRKQFDSYVIIPIKDRSERLLRERQLIKTFDPYFNRNGDRRGIVRIDAEQKRLGISWGDMMVLMRKHNIPHHRGDRVESALIDEAWEAEGGKPPAFVVGKPKNPTLF